MCLKLKDLVLTHIDENQIESPRRVDRRGLKPVADVVCEGLDIGKGQHSAVVGALLALFENGELVTVGGLIVRRSTETDKRVGRRTAGVRKQSCRGGRVVSKPELGFNDSDKFGRQITAALA